MSWERGMQDRRGAAPGRRRTPWQHAAWARRPRSGCGRRSTDKGSPQGDWAHVTDAEREWCAEGTNPTPMAGMRTFSSGATRNVDDSKFDYEGFLSPLVLERFAEYMHQHRIQADGQVRDSDNWQKGIPKDAYMKSGFRHFMDWWQHHRGNVANEELEEALCALMFNVMGYLHEELKGGK